MKKCSWTKRGSDSWYGACGGRVNWVSTHVTKERGSYICTAWKPDPRVVGGKSVSRKTVKGSASQARKACERLARKKL